MNTKSALLLLVGGIVLVSSAGFALFTDVSPLMVGLGSIVGSGILSVAYRPTATFQSLSVISTGSVVIGAYLFLIEGFVVGGILALLGSILGARSYQLYQRRQ
jgi:hypothetical protein